MNTPDTDNDPHALADRWFLTDATAGMSLVDADAVPDGHVALPIALELDPGAAADSDGLRILALSDMHSIPQGYRYC